MNHTEIHLIRKHQAVEKARAEYHSFMRVRELKDIASSYGLTMIMLRLEVNLVDAVADEKSARTALLK
jgi:hypothetical protein